MKRIIVLIVAMAMSLTLFAGCGGKGNTQEDTTQEGANTTTAAEKTEAEAPEIAEVPQEKLICKFVLPGQASQDYGLVAPEINKKLAADGVGIELDRVYIPWDAWEQKVNIMLSTGEEFDLLNVMNDWIPLSTYVGRGALADITQIIDQYGENIKKLNPEIMMNSAKVNDKMYAVPAFWVEFSRGPELTIRKDLLRENNLEVPKNIDELTSAYETVMKNWKGKEKLYLPLIGSNATAFGLAWKSYDSWPFTVVDKIFYVNQNGDVKAFVETEEFKKDCQLARSWYQKKLINPDVLVFKVEQLNNQLSTGNWFAHCGTYGEAVENLQKNFPNITVDDFEFVTFNPEKPNLRPYGTRNLNAVPATSKNPEVGVKFINWLYANQDNYNLFMYGIEGTHYKKIGDKAREAIVDPALKMPRYVSDDWMIGNLEYLLPASNTPVATRNALFTIDETAVNSVAANFVFDATNVKAEIANVKTELQASIAPIVTGVLDYDKYYPAALDKLKKAGLDKVVAEYKLQFDAFRQSQGK